MEYTVKDVVDFYNDHPEYIGKIKTNTRYGYKKVQYADVTSMDSEIIRIETSMGYFLESSPDHRLYVNNDWKKVQELIIGDSILTESGVDYVTNITVLNEIEDLYDFQVEDVHEYYTNGIVSHNSVFLDAIIYALFGKPYRKIAKPNLINSINGKGLETKVHFSITENQKSNQYIIYRGMKPNIFELYINGVKQNEHSSAKDQQKHIEENILKTNYRSFTTIVILGSANYIPFMHLTPSQRREFIESLLDIDIFSTMNGVLKERYGMLKQLKDKVHSKLENQNTLIQKQEKIVQKLQQQKEDVESDIDKEVEIQQERIESQQKEIDNLYEKLNALNQSIESYSTDTLENKKKNITSKINELKAEKKKMQSDKTFMESNTYCPTCKQNIGEEHKRTFINSFQENIDGYEQSLKELNEEYETIIESLQEVQKLNNQYFEITTQLESAENNKKKITKEIKRLEDKKGSIDTRDIQKEQEQLQSYYDEKRKYEERKDILTEKHELYNVAFDLLKDNGIKSRIISQYIPIINKLINQYLQEMDFNVTFTLDETFTEQILSRYRDSFTYDNFSQGEKMRIDIALLMVWRNIAEMKNSLHTNILLMDEVFDSSLDSDGIDNFLEILNNLSKSNNNVYIISHKINQMNSRFDRILTVDKMNDFSYLEIEESEK